MSSLVSCALRSSANVAENFKIKDNVQNLTNLSSNKGSVRMWSFVHLSRNAETIISSIMVRSGTVLYSGVKLEQIANLYFCSSSLSIVKVRRHLSPKLPKTYLETTLWTHTAKPKLYLRPGVDGVKPKLW